MSVSISISISSPKPQAFGGGGGEDCTDREINAVDSEFQAGVTNPFWRDIGRSWGMYMYTYTRISISISISIV